MWPTINKDLLPLKIHYFFKYGGIAFFTFLPVVARQKGIPEVAVGLIWTVTPLASCAVNLINSALADKFKVYRAMFLGGMLTLSLSFLAIFLLPNIAPQTNLGHHNISAPSQCAHLNKSSLALCSYHDPDPESSTPWVCSHEDYVVKKTRKCVMQCSDQNGTDVGETNQTFVFWDLKLNFSTSTSDHYHLCKEGSCTIISTMPLSSCFPEPEIYTCSYICEPEPITLLELMKRVEFWVIFFLLLTVYGSNSTTTTMADTICFQLLGKEGRHLYGRQRLFGSIGWGAVGLAGGALVDFFSHGKDQVNYMPVVVVASVFLGCNLITSALIPFKVQDREKLKASRVGRALCTLPFLLFLVTVVVVGLNMGIVWTFIFIVVEDIAGPSFSHLKLLQGLMLGVGCFLGEVPTLFLSAVVIKKLGSVVTFGISLTAMVVRVFLYSAVRQPWLFVPIDLLHGFSFGLFYPNMIASASHFSPPGAMATVQGIVKTTFITGVSLGALTGGLLVSAVGGSNTFFYLGFFDAAYTVVFVLAQYLMYLRQGGQTGYHAPGTLQVCSDTVAEEQRSVCDLQVCTPCPALLDHPDGNK
ncbi:Major facilitator superfamily domain-containing protein 6 [Chionoecetes opilio]|uniref:Major facilitator superfamily domain-containing protein 6 n=1 Tax=Chionoecetes opilio TaxID=41210 RepID=A0A8J8WFX7_CHIOP|nr:Major facilitator superfamily domain-containing protein 6 [Chionoecetes opilio]